MIKEQVPQTAVVSPESRAYQSGWQDGRFGQPGTFTANANLAAWHALDRLAYYRGHRAGRRVRQMLRGGEISA